MIRLKKLIICRYLLIQEVFINDALIVNNNTFFAGGFKGSLFVNDQLLLHSNASAGFFDMCRFYG